MTTPSRQTLADILFWLLAGVSAVMLVALVLVVGGIVSLEPAADVPDTRTEAIEESAPRAPTVSGSTAPPTEPATTTTATTAAPAPAADLTIVVLRASRGDSWFSARVGSENGRVLDERVLAQGESVRLRARRIWLTVGAAGNVDVTVDGKPRALSPGTVSVVLTQSAGAGANS